MIRGISSCQPRTIEAARLFRRKGIEATQIRERSIAGTLHADDSGIEVITARRVSVNIVADETYTAVICRTTGQCVDVRKRASRVVNVVGKIVVVSVVGIGIKGGAGVVEVKADDRAA